MYHIIFLSPHSDPEAVLGEPDSGGQCVYEHELALALSALPDFKVITFCRQTFRRPDVVMVNNNYFVSRITCGSTEFIPKEQIENVLQPFSRVIHRYIASFPASDTIILHAHYWDGAFVALWLKQHSQRILPCVWTPHSLGSVKRRKFPGEANEELYHFIPRLSWENFMVMAADAVIVSSEKEKQDLLADYAGNEAKTHIIPPGVYFEPLVKIDAAEARKKCGFPFEGKILLCMGRIVKTKGYHRAIKALAAVKKVYDQPVSLVIVGGSSTNRGQEEKEYLTELKALVSKLGLEKEVLFMPAVGHDKINEVLSAADVYLMSSEHEPFGLITIEAMGIGLPVIAANSGGSLNIVTHNQTGILADFHDSRRIAAYLLSLFKDQRLYSKISEGGKRQARREYDWYDKSAQFAQVYRQVCRSQPVTQFQETVKNTFFLHNYFSN